MSSCASNGRSRRPSEFDPGRSDRQFTMCSSPTTRSRRLFRRLLAACQRRARKQCRFNFLHQVDAPERLLERGDVDLLIIPREFCSRQHPFEVVLEEEFCAIVWSRGELAREQTNASRFARRPMW